MLVTTASVNQRLWSCSQTSVFPLSPHYSTIWRDSSSLLTPVDSFAFSTHRCVCLWLWPNCTKMSSPFSYNWQNLGEFQCVKLNMVLWSFLGEDLTFTSHWWRNNWNRSKLKWKVCAGVLYVQPCIISRLVKRSTKSFWMRANAVDPTERKSSSSLVNSWSKNISYTRFHRQGLIPD